MLLKKTVFFRLIKEPGESASVMGRSTRYYLSMYDLFYGKKKWFASWNWASFLSALFGVELVWLVYRRMYFYVACYFLGLFLITNATFFSLYFANKHVSADIKEFLLQKFADKDFLFFSLKMVLWLIKLPVILAFGVFGNALYFRFLEKEARQKYLPKNGVSVVGAGLVLLVTFALVFFNNYLLHTANTNLYSKIHDYFV